MRWPLIFRWPYIMMKVVLFLSHSFRRPGQRMGSLQAYDIMILIIVGWLTLRGASRGMVSQIAAIVAVIASFWAAIRFGSALAPIMESNFNAQPPWNKVLGITLAFVGASIVVMFLHRIVARIICVIRMQKFDRLCGALFGFTKGVLIGMILTFFAVMLSEQTREMAVNSHSGKILVRLIQHSQSLMPEDVSVLIETNLKGFVEQIESGKETAEETMDQAKTVSLAVSNIKNAVVSIQSGLSPISQQISGSNDPADKQPRLSGEASTSTASDRRGYTVPSLTVAKYPEELENVTSQMATMSPGIASSPTTATGSTTANAGGVTTSTASVLRTGGSLFTAEPSGIVAPSAGLVPMTSSAASPTPATRETNWRVLLRETR